MTIGSVDTLSSFLPYHQTSWSVPEQLYLSNNRWGTTPTSYPYFPYPAISSLMHQPSSLATNDLFEQPLACTQYPTASSNYTFQPTSLQYQCKLDDDLSEIDPFNPKIFPRPQPELNLTVPVISPNFHCKQEPTNLESCLRGHSTDSSRRSSNETYATTDSSQSSNVVNPESFSTNLFDDSPAGELWYPDSSNPSPETDCSMHPLSVVTSESNASPVLSPTFSITEPTTSRKSSPSEGVCSVCGDHAACQHYGVKTCEGCKGFFKRTVQKNARYVCLQSKACTVDKRHRNRCQYCRFQKCLKVGMVKEVVRTDSLKGRRGRLPSKPKSPLSSQNSTSPPPYSPDNSNMLTRLVKAHHDSQPRHATLGHLFESMETDKCDSTEFLYDMLSEAYEAVYRWAVSLPDYNSLHQTDQEYLIETSWLELFILRLAYRSRPAKNEFVTEQSVCVSCDRLETAGKEWLKNLMHFSSFINQMSIDIEAFSCLSTLVLLYDRPGLADYQRLEHYQTRVTAALKDHLNFNQAQTSQFSKLVMIIPKLKSLSQEGKKSLKIMASFSPPPAAVQKLLDDASSSS